MLKLRFYLLGLKGYETLTNIVNKFGNEIIEEVIIGTDKNIQNDYAFETRQFCEDNSLKMLDKHKDIHKVNNYSVAIGWRRIIDLKRVKNLIVLHDSLLPKYRGFNPLVSALINGDNKIGVTALFAEEHYDTGDIIFQSQTSIKYPLKLSEAISIISENYINVCTKIVETLLNEQQLPRAKQKENDASYSLWRDDEDYQIDWHWDNKRIKRFIDAVGYPYKNASTTIDGIKLRVIDVEEIDDVNITNRTPGKVIFIDEGYPVVVCGHGLLKIVKILVEEDGTEFKLNKFRVRFK